MTMTRIHLSGLFLVSLLCPWTQGQTQSYAQDLGPKNTNNFRFVSEDVNAYYEAEDNSELPEPRYPAYPAFQRPVERQPVPYYEEKNYEFQYGIPKVYEDRQYTYNRVPAKQDLINKEHDYFSWPFMIDDDEAQPVVSQEPTPTPVIVAEPCTVTEVVTSTYYVRAHPIVSTYTVQNVQECAPTTKPEIRVEPKMVSCDVCAYPQNCNHCTHYQNYIPHQHSQPEVVKVTPIPAPIQKISCDKCQHPQNCNHCPQTEVVKATPVPVPIQRIQACDKCQSPQNCDHCPQPPKTQMACKECRSPANCDHCDPYIVRIAGPSGSQQQGPKLVAQPTKFPHVSPQLLETA